MTTGKKILISSFLIAIFIMMSGIIYKTEQDKKEARGEYEVTNARLNDKKREVDSLTKVIDEKESVIKNLEQEVDRLKEEKKFLTQLPDQEDIKKIKFK